MLSYGKRNQPSVVALSLGIDSDVFNGVRHKRESESETTTETNENENPTTVSTVASPGASTEAPNSRSHSITTSYFVITFVVLLPILIVKM